MERWVFTVATGAPRYAEMALGLARSLELAGDSSPRLLISDVQAPALSKWFDRVQPPDPGVPPYLRKLEAFRTVGGDAALFVDSDTIAFGRLDPIYRHCAGKPLAVQGEPRRTGHWYGPLADLLPRHGLTEMMRFNGGMIYQESGPAFERLRATVHQIATDYEATGFERFRGQVPDEPCIALAMARTGVGELIPNDLDFMNTPVGLVGKLRMDVTRGECVFLKRGNRMRLIRPILLHAAKYVNHLCYWRELRKLERLMP